MGNIRLLSFIKIYLLIVLLTATICNILPRLSNDTQTIPKHKLNLDLPVKERYRDLLIENKNKVKAYALVTSMMPLPFLISKLGKYMKNKKSQDPEWIDYIEAVSEFCEIPFSQAIMLSITYEMACTSVIIQDRLNKIMMARNLDFGTYFVTAHLTFEAEYYKNGEFLYRGVEIFGYRGAINAVKPGKFSVSLNLRKQRKGEKLDIAVKLKNMYRVFKGHPTPNFFLMKVMETANSYTQAVNMLSEMQLSAAVYYIISGIDKDEGAIITRDADRVYHVDTLDTDKGKWFLVVCNTDLDEEETESDFRKVPTENSIKKIGRNGINYDNLFKDVMSIYPTNNLITVYTTVQSAGEGYFNTTIWLP